MRELRGRSGRARVVLGIRVADVASELQSRLVRAVTPLANGTGKTVTEEISGAARIHGTFE